MGGGGGRRDLVLLSKKDDTTFGGSLKMTKGYLGEGGKSGLLSDPKMKSFLDRPLKVVGWVISVLFISLAFFWERREGQMRIFLTM